MMRLIPFAVIAALLVVGTYLEGEYSERWTGRGATAKQMAPLIKQLPMRVGNWVGEDQEVDEQTQRTAGAQGYVSRAYRNERSGAVVSIWLMVGHVGHAGRHQPTVCYPAQGYDQPDSVARHQLRMPDQEPANMFTTIFSKQSQNARVFWTWFRPKVGTNAPVRWEVPTSTDEGGALSYFGGAKSLFKLYLTAIPDSADEKADDSICLRFAEDFLPALNKVLAPANGDPAAIVDTPVVEEEASKG